MKIIPLENYIVVKVVEKNDLITKSGLILPSSASEEVLMRGDVVESGVKFIKVGYRILFKKYSPDIIVLDGDKYSIVKIDDVFGVIEDDNERPITLEQDFEADTLQPSNPKFNKKYNR